MTKITRTIIFLLVLAGLLTWGVSTLAQGPTVTSVSTKAIVLEGQVMGNGVELSRDQVRPFSR